MPEMRSPWRNEFAPASMWMRRCSAGQVRLERENGHRFITDVVEAFPGEIEAISVSKPSLEDVFIHRTGHKFWTEDGERPS